MPVLVALAALIGGICFFVWRAHYAVQTVKAAKEVDRHTGLGRHARNAGSIVFGTCLTRVNDPRLAAVILMLQLVRTGAPVTAAEKTQIMELMEDPLQISNIEMIFVRAWSYTEANRVFSRIADELVPMLRTKLTVDERLQLVDMLRKVANAYGEASELQTEAINRLKRRLTMADPSFVSPIEKPFGD